MRRRRLFPVLMILILITSFLPHYPGEAAPAPAWVPLSKPLNLEGQGTIELKTIYAVPNQQGTMVSFAFELKNRSSSLIDFYQYWIRLHSKTGARYPVSMVDPGRTRVYPGQTETFLFYSQLPPGAKVEDLIVKLIKWDFSLPDFERPIGTFPIHTPTIPLLGKTVTKTIPLTNNALVAKMELGGEVDQEGVKDVTFILSLTNKGFQPLPLPNYQYMLVTENGYGYPFTASGEDTTGGQGGSGEMLLPLMEKKITLTGTVPANVDLTKVGLYLLNNYGDEKGSALVPITVFRTFATVGSPVDEGKSIPFGTSYSLPLGPKGKGTITLDQVQRLPWNEKDLLSARFTITNTGNTPFAIPSFDGFAYLAGGTYAGDVTPSSTEKMLNPGEKVTYTLSAQFPYHVIFHDGNVQLKEKVSDGGRVLLSSLPKFGFNEGNLVLNLIPVGKASQYGALGNQRSVRIADAVTYDSLNSLVMAAHVEVKNLERRSYTFPKMTAFFQTEDGSLYPAKVDEVATLMPNGVSVITASAEMPEDVKTEKVRLLLGESIEDKGVRDVSAYALPKENLSASENLSEMNFYPYTVKFLQYSNDMAAIHVEKVPGATVNFGDRRIVFEFTNDYGNTSVVRTETIAFDATMQRSKDLDIGGFRYVNVYDELRGARRLIGLKALSQP